MAQKRRDQCRRRSWLCSAQRCPEGGLRDSASPYHSAFLGLPAADEIATADHAGRDADAYRGWLFAVSLAGRFGQRQPEFTIGSSPPRARPWRSRLDWAVDVTNGPCVRIGRTNSVVMDEP